MADEELEKVEKIITNCEVKFLEKKVTSETCLISLNGADKAVIESNYFNYLLNVSDLLKQ